MNGMIVDQVSNDHTDLGNEWDDSGPNIVNDNTITANTKILSLTTNFSDITIKTFT